MLPAASDLDAALAAFARSRSGELAQHIDELGRDAIASFEPPRPRKNLEFHRAWIEHARDPRIRT
jgi:hypothetical protein